MIPRKPAPNQANFNCLPLPLESRYCRRMRKRFGIALSLGVTAMQLAAGESNRVLFAENFQPRSSNHWQNVAFFKPPTDYKIVHDGTNCFVRGVARTTCSGFTVNLDIEPPQRLKLHWRWKIEGVAPRGSERDLKRFDHTARVFIAFDTFIGPARTINYTWATDEKPGTALEHPKSGRAQIIVLQSGNARTNEWIAEERDVRADWRRVFGARPMPKIIGLGVMTDSDSTGAMLTGYYTDFRLMAE